MKGKGSYIPIVGELVLISSPNCDNENGYVYEWFNVLWINDLFILYGRDGLWPVLNKLEHVHIKKIDAESILNIIKNDIVELRNCAHINCIQEKKDAYNSVINTIDKYLQLITVF